MTRSIGPAEIPKTQTGSFGWMDSALGHAVVFLLLEQGMMGYNMSVAMCNAQLDFWLPRRPHEFVSCFKAA